MSIPCDAQGSIGRNLFSLRSRNRGDLSCSAMVGKTSYHLLVICVGGNLDDAVIPSSASAFRWLLLENQ